MINTANNEVIIDTKNNGSIKSTIILYIVPPTNAYFFGLLLLNISPIPPDLAFLPKDIIIAAMNRPFPQDNAKYNGTFPFKLEIVIYFKRITNTTPTTPKVPALLSFIISKTLSFSRAEKKPSKVSEIPSKCNPPVNIIILTTAKKEAISLFIFKNK